MGDRLDLKMFNETHFKNLTIGYDDMHAALDSVSHGLLLTRAFALFIKMSKPGVKTNFCFIAVTVIYKKIKE